MEPGQIVVARARQVIIDGWVARARAGTKTAKAADEATAKAGPAVSAAPDATAAHDPAARHTEESTEGQAHA